MSTPSPAPAGSAERLQQDTDALLRMLAEGGTLGTLMGLSHEQLEALYAMGLGYYGQARWADAMKVFARLVIYRHGEPRYLNALASTHQMLGRHDRAIHFWGVSQLLEPGDPAPTYHTARSLLALGLVDDALDALDLVLRQCSGRDAHRALAERAGALQDLVRRKAATAAAAQA